MRETASSQNPPDAAWASPPLDRTSPLPLYAQIKQRLIALILRWDQPDRRFYSDEQLCAVFCVSRETVRQALAELVREGLLRRGRGVGTFVSMRKLEERFGPGMDFLRQWESSGVPMHSTLLAFERRQAGDTVGAALGLNANAIVLFIKRVRAAVRVPVAIDYRYIPNDLVADWDETSAGGSPLHLLWQRVELCKGDFAIEAGAAGPEEIEYLHLSANAPVLIRNLRYCDVNGRHVMAGHTVHRGDLVRYSLQVPLAREGAPAEDTVGCGGVHDD
jgi:GntR family transcriptional regulator